MAAPPTDHESQRQLQLLAALICGFIVENTAIVNDDDALAVAHRIHNAGFVLASSTTEAQQNYRLNVIEDRLLAIESWAGVTRT